MDQPAASVALLSPEKRFQLLVDAVTDYAIFMLDPHGIVVSWNSGAQRIKGFTANEIIGRHFSRFYTPEDQEADLPARALATAAREGRFEKEDGSRVPFGQVKAWRLSCLASGGSQEDQPICQGCRPGGPKWRAGAGPRQSTLGAS